MLNNLSASLENTLHTVRDVLRFAARRAREERIDQVAGSLTFTTMLSIVPLFTIIFAVLTALPIFAQLQLNLRDWLAQNLIPAAISDTIFRYLNQFASKARGLTLVGVAFLILTALSTVLTIDRALNTIWHVRRPRPLSRRVLVYWVVLTIGPILLSASLTLTSYVSGLSTNFGDHPPLAIRLLLDLVPLVLMALAYAALYVYVPNRYVAWRDALAGGLFAAVAFELTKRGFTAFLTNFRSFTAIYGALAALPIFLLWIYLSWLVTLLGASVAACLPTLYDRNWNRGDVPGQDYADVLRILRALYRARQNQGRPPGLLAHEVRDQARMGWDEVVHFLEQLEALGLVVRSRRIVAKGATHTGHEDLWFFAADPHTIQLERLFRQFAFDGKRAAHVGLSIDDPLAETLRATRPVNAGTTLAEAWGTL